MVGHVACSFPRHSPAPRSGKFPLPPSGVCTTELEPIPQFSSPHLAKQRSPSVAHQLWPPSLSLHSLELILISLTPTAGAGLVRTCVLHIYEYMLHYKTTEVPRSSPRRVSSSHVSSPILLDVPPVD